ncbi:MAG: class I SAM-dependent methyltransferase [Oligoflexales bacterium]|nr:class I SAM-dependent methyltransferase [Oligoflexales bacterium]
MKNIDLLYQYRFNEKENKVKYRIWQILCESYFQRFIPESSTVMDLAAGYGEFIKNIKAKEKIAIDINPNSKAVLSDDIRFHSLDATDLYEIESGSIDIVFVSNFFEHLKTKMELDKVFVEINRVLKPEGKLLVMQPNIRYCYNQYWDFYDHYTPLSHFSAIEGLKKSGFTVEKVIPKFLPFSTKSFFPKNSFLIRAYLMFPIFWPLFGKQFFIVARKSAFK